MLSYTTSSFGDITRFELSNGLALVARPNAFIPAIAVRGSFRGGASLESDDTSGLTKLTALLLKSGTENRNAVRIAEELDFMGSSVSFTANHDALNFTLTSLSKHFERSLAILADLLIRPSFPNDEIERMRRLALADIKQKADQPMQIASDVFNESLFVRHPYRRSTDGAATTIGQFTREHIIEGYRKTAPVGRLILAVTGDFDPQALVQLVIDQFSAMRTHDGTYEPLYEPVKTPGKKVVLVERDLTQANICLGNIGCKRDVPDYYATVLMNYILGGSGLTSRLTHRIRTQHGLAYSVYSQMARRLAGGSFSVRMQTKTENAVKATELILDEMKRMQDERVTNEEIDDAKSFFQGSFPFRIQTNHDYAYYLEQGEFYQLNLDYLNREVEMIRQVSRDDILSAAQKYLDTENYVLTVVSKTETLKTVLKPFGMIEEKQMTF